MTKIPKTRLRNDALDEIKSALKQRDALTQHISRNLSNKALAKRFGVHVTTIERFTKNEAKRAELRAAMRIANA